MFKIISGIGILFFSLFLAVTGFAQKKEVKIPQGPFPIKSVVEKSIQAPMATIHTYPDYAEIYGDKDLLIFRAGILSDKGTYKIFTVLSTESPKLVAYTDGVVIRDMQGRFIGSYYRTPVYSYTYSKDGKRLGRVKCIAFSAVCGLISSVYLILLS